MSDHPITRRDVSRASTQPMRRVKRGGPVGSPITLENAGKRRTDRPWAITIGAEDPSFYTGSHVTTYTVTFPWFGHTIFATLLRG